MNRNEKVELAYKAFDEYMREKHVFILDIYRIVSVKDNKGRVTNYKYNEDRISYRGPYNTNTFNNLAIAWAKENCPRDYWEGEQVTDEGPATVKMTAERVDALPAPIPCSCTDEELNFWLELATDG